MKRKLIALLLSAAVLASLSGCGQKNAEENADQQQSVEQEASEDGGTQTETEGNDVAAEAGTAGEWDVPYEETVTLHTVTSEYASAQYPEGDDITSNEWIRQYLKRYNIEVVTDWVSDDYDTKINLAIANNDIPDVFHVTGSQFRQLAEAGLLYDMTEIWDEWASERVKGYMEADPASFESGKVDGRLYGIPQLHYGFIEQPDFIWLRKDWMEEQGLTAPETIEDLENICFTFMEKYGGYGMAVDQNLDMLNLLAIAWHAYPGVWLEKEDGTIAYGSVQPEMKDALAKYAEWYQNGILSQDFPNYDFDAMNEAVVSGLVGVQPFYQWWGYNPGGDVVGNLGSDAYFEPYPIPSADGEKVLQGLVCGNSSYVVVSKNCKNPEAVLKLIDFYAYIQNDSAGTADESLSEPLMRNDMSHVVGAFRVLPPLADQNAFELVYEAMKTGDASLVQNDTNAIGKYDTSQEWLTNHSTGALGDFLQQGNGDRSAYAVAKKYLDDGDYILSKLWGIDPPTLLQLGSNLNDMLKEGYTKIIIGAEPLDYFDTVVQSWYDAGGQQVTSEMNEMYGNK